MSFQYWSSVRRVGGLWNFCVVWINFVPVGDLMGVRVSGFNWFPSVSPGQFVWFPCFFWGFRFWCVNYSWSVSVSGF